MVAFSLSFFSFVLLFALPRPTSQACYEDRKTFSKNIAKAGYTRCTEQQDLMYIRGFERKKGSEDNLKDFAMAKCCQPPKMHLGKPFTIQAADWEMSFKKEGWATCQDGFFLHGFYREDSNQLGSVRWATCAKPALHPNWYKECYDQDLDEGKLWKCNRANFYVVGIHRGAADTLSSINKLRCCNMYNEVLPLKSLEQVKTRAMDLTMNNLGLLANYLGYGWSGGCRTPYSGEDFRREGDTWRSNYQEPCDGHMKKQRLKIVYENFAFKVKNMEYLKPEIKSLKPIVQDIGEIRNKDGQPTTTRIVREIKTVRTVVHSSESRFGSKFGASVTLSYKSPPLSGVLTGTFSASVTLSGGQEGAQINKDDKGEIKWDIVRVKESQKTNGNAGSSYQITTSKKQVDVPYKATIQVQFTAKLEGFMRWGGDDLANANFHEKHRGKGDRAQVSYQIGTTTSPFYKFLKKASQRGDSPWLWHDMKQKYENAAKVIDLLTDESLYEFELEGKFHDLSGLDFRVKWSDIPVGRSNVTVST